MERKKSEKLDIEKKRGLFFWIGLSLSLIFVIAAFEWKSEVVVVKFDDSENVFEELEIIKATIQEEPKPPQPQKKKLIAPNPVEVSEEDKADLEVEYTFDPEDLEDIPDIEPEDIPDDSVTTYFPGVIESNPYPHGGYEGFYSFVGKQIRYPREAQRLGVEGRVFVQFVVNEKGEIVETEVIRGIGAGCDEEAIRVLKNSPSWNPGKQRGRPVRQRMVLPITFKLN